MKEELPVAKNPLILRFHRLMDAFTKSDDERDFYLDSVEGFIVYSDLDKSEEDLKQLETEIKKNQKRYYLIPKMTFYEVKKFMEGFVNEKIYDIDTKEKLLDIIGSKDSRENFLEFIYDHLTELEKWQQYYQERSRIKIIEWLRSQNIHFVFEEDLEINANVLEKTKRMLFDTKVPKDVSQAREVIKLKSKTYYSNEALNPRPKRGRPPKQQVKVEVEPQFTIDIYSKVPRLVRPFLYIPDIRTPAAVTFSAKFETEEHLLASLRGTPRSEGNEKLEALSERLESLRHLSERLAGKEKALGIEPLKVHFAPTGTPKLKKTVDGTGGKKIGAAFEGALTGEKEEKKDSSGVFTPQKRRGGSIRRVTPIKKKKQ